MTQFHDVFSNHCDYRSSLAVQEKPRVVQLMSAPYKGDVVLNACPAHFGLDLSKGDVGVSTTPEIQLLLVPSVSRGS